MKVSVCRKAHFNAAHRLYNSNWSHDKNQTIFGKCNNPNFHGHNYEIEVWIKGDVDPDTGYVIDLGDLKQIIYEEIEQAFDHKNLNLDVPEFSTLIPTAEHIAFVSWNKLRKRISKDKSLKVRLYETPRNFVEYDGEE